MEEKKLNELIKAGNIAALQRYFAKEVDEGEIESPDPQDDGTPKWKSSKVSTQPAAKDRNHGQPPLHIAIEAKLDNRLAVMRTLLEYGGGTYFYAVDRSKWTPLHVRFSPPFPTNCLLSFVFAHIVSFYLCRWRATTDI